MGRSAPSCFKIITCASDSIDRDDLEASQTKGSSDKRGWSFRKRSPKHRVVNNTVISELSPSGNKEIQESEANNSNIPEKPYEVQCKDETSPLATSVNSKLSDLIAATEDSNKLDIDHNENEESVVIVIQAATRGFLARRSLMKHKNVVKLQAAVRGHLVRNHAVGSLRCVQAIIKMQALVRARQAHLSAQGSILGKQNVGMKPDLNSPTIEKLLSNSFARQLMESTPKTKPVKIKCDPSRSDSAWKWLERWVSVSPTRIQQSLKPDLSAQKEEQDNDKAPENQVENATASTDYCESTYLPSLTGEPPVPSESEENSAIYKSESFEMQPNAENTVLPSLKENSDLPPNEALPSDLELNSGSGEPELETEPPNKNNSAPEQPETEGRKVVFGSRKASNPAFIAAQSKFEELTSSAKSINSSYQDSEAETCTSATENPIKTTKKEVDLAEDSLPHNPTALSISSTLDSPDRSENLAVEQERQFDVLEEAMIDPKIKKRSFDEVDIEAKAESITVQPEQFDHLNSTESVLVGDSSQIEEQKEEENSYAPTEVGPKTVDEVVVCKSPSPEASPIVPESQRTPSSQVSPPSKAKKTKQKRKSLSAEKRSPMKPTHDSGARSRFEKLPKEHNNKTDEEPRDGGGTSSNSLPSYMQATESAKAKAHASSGSPRSSPDVQEKDILVKKRYSLPGANGRHGSPQIQRSKSQVPPHNTKGSTTQPSQERKWQR